MAVPVFLVHWDAPNWVRSATKSVLQSDIDVAVTVINNGPAGIVLDLDPRVRVVDAGANTGYAGGANIGLRMWLEGDEPYCVVGSHDLHVEPNTLRLLVEAADADPDLGIVAPNLGDETAKGELIATVNGVEIRPWASGTCLLLRRECIEAVGLFDEDFGSYVEDRELGLRATGAGVAVGRVTDAAASGLGSGSSDSLRMITANHVLLAWKQQGPRGALRRFAASCWAALIRARSDRLAASQLLRGALDGARKVAVTRRAR